MPAEMIVTRYLLAGGAVVDVTHAANSSSPVLAAVRELAGANAIIGQTVIGRAS